MYTYKITAKKVESFLDEKNECSTKQRKEAYLPTYHGQRSSRVDSSDLLF